MKKTREKSPQHIRDDRSGLQHTYSQKLGRPENWQDIFSVLNWKNMQPRILNPGRLSFKIGQIKSFPDKQKLKESMITKPALQEILRGIL